MYALNIIDDPSIGYP